LANLEINQLDALSAKPADADVFALDDIDAAPIKTKKVRYDELGFLELSGGTMTGTLTLSGAPTLDLHAATKKYVDDTSGVGEANTASNVGLGVGIFDIKNGVDLEFNSLIGGTGIDITDTVRDLTIAVDGTVALHSEDLSVFAATTSLQLLGVISDETGSGLLVFGTSPTLITPALGTPSALVLTNATGLPIATGLATGTKANLESVLSDVSDLAEADGDTYTGAHLFNAATMRIPLSATPVMAVDGDFAIDTTVIDFSHGIMKYFDGEEIGVVSMPIAQFVTPTDGFVIAYNATNDEFELVGAGAGEANTLSSVGGGTVDLAATPSKVGVDLRTKTLSVTAPITLSDMSNDITIATDFTISSTDILTNKTLNDFTNDVHADTIHVQIRNESGGTINKGDVVFISGFNVGQDLPLVSLADSSSISTMPGFCVVEDTSIANNANGDSIAAGRVVSFDTSSFSIGDALYVSNVGTTGNTLTATKPTGNDIVQKIAFVEKICSIRNYLCNWGRKGK